MNNYKNNYQKSKQYLIDVFNDTMNQINNDSEYSQVVLDSIADQRFIEHNDLISIKNKPTYDKEAEVKITKSKTMEAARKYSENDKIVAVLNFASATTPGGGVKNGSTAQEECLCRVSTLLPCIDSEMPNEKFYKPHRKAKNPLHNDDIIYTKDVLVIKDDNYNLLDEPFYVDVITCAAPNLRQNPSNKHNVSDGKKVDIDSVDLYELHKSRARKIIMSAISNGVQVLVLGAFGCGVFQNPPEIVASAYKKVIDEFKYYFETIEFAIYCRPGDETNYNAFKTMLK